MPLLKMQQLRWRFTANGRTLLQLKGSNETKLSALCLLPQSSFKTRFLANRPRLPFRAGTIRFRDGAFGIHLSSIKLCTSGSEEKSLGAIAPRKHTRSPLPGFMATLKNQSDKLNSKPLSTILLNYWNRKLLKTSIWANRLGKQSEQRCKARLVLMTNGSLTSAELKQPLQLSDNLTSVALGEVLFKDEIFNRRHR